MTNTELAKIREEKKLSKKEFADLIGVTPMLLGRYEKGSCAIPESIAEKLTATEIEVKKNTRKASRKAKEKMEEAATAVKETAKKATGIPNIIIQSPMGGYITCSGTWRVWTITPGRYVLNS